MKSYKFAAFTVTVADIALVVALTGFISSIVAIETPRKPKRDGTIHVLPRVEDMPRVANPLQF